MVFLTASKVKLINEIKPEIFVISFYIGDVCTDGGCLKIRGLEVDASNSIDVRLHKRRRCLTFMNSRWDEALGLRRVLTFDLLSSS